MKRILFTANVCLVLMFASLMVLIRAQPYNDSELRDFLMPPDDCPAPCFMGIQPGVTTVEEAIAILEAHEWVDEIIVTDRKVEWFWRRQVSNFIDNNQAGWFDFGGDKVARMIIPLHIKLGDSWIWMGYPQKSNMAGDVETANPFVWYVMLYPGIDYILGTNEICPIKMLWHSQIYLTLQVRTDSIDKTIDLLSPNQAFAICKRIMAYYR